MGYDDELIGLYIEAMRASGRKSLRSIESTLRTADTSDKLQLGLEAAERREIVAWLGRVRPDGQPVYTEQTRASYLVRLSGFFAWAVDEGYLDCNPLAGTKAPKVPRGLPNPLTEHELLTLLTMCGDNPGLRWLRVAIALAGWAGLRCCEITQLCASDVGHRRILIRRGKGGHARAAGSHDRIWREIADLPAGPVMESTGGRCCPDWLSRTSRYWMRRWGIPQGGLHRARHRFGTRLLAHPRATTRHVQIALGHASLDSTEVYTGVEQDELEDLVAALPDVDA